MFKRQLTKSFRLGEGVLSSSRLFSSSNLCAAEAPDKQTQNQRWAASVKKSRPHQPVGSAIQASINSMQRNQEASKREAEKNAIDNSFVKKFQPGSTYDPFDFSLARLRLDKINQQAILKKDRFKKVKLNPLALWTVSI
ncbi:mitochondrial 37S ribosomal protein RSM18 [Sugiyamaella lignohabitans]|uniref:Mitochondrial 37S ribosomal protein RSM18 n=1 Tax=Sugiyamaella lignohabitans TaxID=796027 RepID=A0A167D7K3_9ASCO|nr:mitochondrial 37S ribosomal protein RSM18 [Sugiyamaella lignohabitans]ANB12580.1 mitochondrial 37S ribosomal protein RSM18 [Sugiyamaella lignohabitans]